MNIRTHDVAAAPTRRSGLQLLSIAVLGMLVAACSVVRGSGNVVTEQRQVEAFDAIELSNSADLLVEAGSEQAVTVEGDDNIVDLIATTVRDGRLVIATERNRRFIAASGVTVRVAAPSIAFVASSGSGSADISGVDGDALALDVSGSGSLIASGRVDRLTVDASGSGSVDAAQLEAADAEADVSGSGSVELAASDALRADVSGSGSVAYHGSPTVQADVSGSGSVDPAG